MGRRGVGLVCNEGAAKRRCCSLATKEFAWQQALFVDVNRIDFDAI